MIGRATEINRLRDIKTLQGSKKRSIPRVQSSSYLDLYMLRKEKDRLEKEFYILSKRNKNIQNRLNEIDKEMEMLEKEEGKKRQTSLSKFKKPKKKEWRAMLLKY
jgi:predicted nuclease with TOPRIM domain